MREIVTDWVIGSGGGKVSVMYFDDSISVATQRTALETFWIGVQARLSNETQWAIRTSGRELNAATGTLTGEWSETTGKLGAGTVAGEAVPDSSQVLVRWITGVVVDGRFLRGRTFVPGVARETVTNGNVSNVVVGEYTAEANVLAQAGVGLQVWHRPTSGSGGVAHNVSGATVWTEFAVLRERRG